MADKNLVPKLFGAALTKARTSRHMSRYRLAKLIGHQQVRITKLENGESDLRLSSILALTEALGITPGELLDDMAAEYYKIRASSDKKL